MKVVHSRLIQSYLIPDVVAAIEGRILEPYCYVSVVQSSIQLDDQVVDNFNAALTHMDPQLIPPAIVNSAPQRILTQPYVSIVAVSSHLTLVIPLSAQTRLLTVNPLMSAEESAQMPASAYQLVDALLRLHNQHCSSWLYVCEFVDTNSIIHGLRRVNRRLRYQASLAEDGWWERQLIMRYPHLDISTLNNSDSTALREMMIIRRRLKQTDLIVRSLPLFYAAPFTSRRV